MSRSYKKTPIAKDGHSGRFGKKTGNRMIRRFDGSVSNGNMYRKIFNSMEIHDCISYCSYASFKKEQESREKETRNGLDGYSSWYSDDQNWLNTFKRK